MPADHGRRRLAAAAVPRPVDACRRRDGGQGGQVILLHKTIWIADWTLVFQGVMLSAHDERSVLLQPGMVEHLHALHSLGEHGQLSRLRRT